MRGKIDRDGQRKRIKDGNMTSTMDKRCGNS